MNKKIFLCLTLILFFQPNYAMTPINDLEAGLQDAQDETVEQPRFNLPPVRLRHMRDPMQEQRRENVACAFKICILCSLIGAIIWYTTAPQYDNTPIHLPEQVLSNMTTSTNFTELAQNLTQHEITPTTTDNNDEFTTIPDLTDIPESEP